jgi:hypothetical protein
MSKDNSRMKKHARGKEAGTSTGDRVKKHKKAKLRKAANEVKKRALAVGEAEAAKQSQKTQLQCCQMRCILHWIKETHVACGSRCNVQCKYKMTHTAHGRINEM